MQILAIATAIAVVCALHPIPNQGARHCGDLFSVALGEVGREVLHAADGVQRLARVSAEAQRNEPATKGDCYITMANAKAMYDGIDLQKLGNVDTDQVFSADLSKILSANEQRWLVAARMLYEDFALFIEHAYSKDRRTSDGLRFARKKAPPAYHLDQMPELGRCAPPSCAAA